jgi:hypothetical protein
MGALFSFTHFMAPAKNAPGASPELGKLRGKITDLVARNAIAMVQCAIDGVMEEGQYQAIKYLFEMVGIYPAVAGQTEEPEDTLAKVLLQHLGVAVPEAEQVPGESSGSETHPVK